MNKILFSSKSDEWSTPQDLFDQLDQEFHFNLDPCASITNHKCRLYYTKEENGLIRDWSNHNVFCNPPYGKEIEAWVRKCYIEGSNPGTIVVLLIPARTDTQYFHKYILNKAEIRFIKGRLKFGNSKYSAPFPSLIAIYR